MSSSLALDHLASGKVREIYDAGDGRLLLVASDRISAFDVVLPTPIPDKGRVLTAPLAALVRADRRHRAQPRHLGQAERLSGGGARSRSRRPHAARATARDAAARVRGARLPGRLGLEGLRAHRRRLRHPAARGPARGRPPAEHALHAVDQGHRGPRREHHRRAGHRARRRAALPRGRARLDRALRARGRRGAGARHHPGRHEVRVRDRHRRLARGGRRGADARLVALLAGRQLRARAPRRRPSTSSSCATGSRRSRGTRRLPAPSCPTRSATAPPRATARPTSDWRGGRSQAYLDEMGVRAA